jgi:ASPM-SPD-2-Hydin domain-containing protein
MGSEPPENLAPIVSWCEIAISLIDPEKGEEKEHTRAIALSLTSGAEGTISYKIFVCGSQRCRLPRTEGIVRRLATITLFGSWFIGCGGGAGTPAVSFSPSSLTFGTQALGTTSQSLTLTLSNPGTSTLAISSISASSGFAETNNCGTALSAASKCDITVTFMPMLTGANDGTITITDNASGSPQSVDLTGTGTSSGPSCSVAGQQCGAPQLPACCPGLTCVPASTRAFCQ